MLEPQQNFLRVNYSTIEEDTGNVLLTDSEDESTEANEDQNYSQLESRDSEHQDKERAHQNLTFNSVMETNRQTKREMDNWHHLYWRQLEDLYHLTNDVENTGKCCAILRRRTRHVCNVYSDNLFYRHSG